MIYYVDNTAPADGDGTSWGTAWSSFSAIDWRSIKPGDTVQISGGTVGQTYLDALDIGASGTASAPITIMASTDSGQNGTVTIEGSNTTPDAVSINGQNYITVSGLNVRDIADAGFSVKNATGVTIQNNSVYSGDPGGGNARGYDIRSSTSTLVEQNSYSTPTSTTAQTDGIYSQGNDQVVFASNRIIIANSDTTGHSDGFESYDDKNVIVRNNWFEQANSAAVNNHGAWISDGQTGGTIQFYNNIVLAPNLTSDSAVTDYIEPSWTGTGAVDFWDNTIIGGQRGVNLAGANLAQVENNIIEPAPGGTGVMILPGTTVAPPSIDHNLIWAPNGTVATISGSALTWAQWQAGGYDLHGVNAGPNFLNASEGVYNPAVGSPAIGRGAPLSGVTTDYDGMTRAQQPTIGALEGPSAASGATTCTSTSSRATVSPETITLALAARGSRGAPNFVAKVDGVTLNQPTAVTATQQQGENQTVEFIGNWAAGVHDFETDFASPQHSSIHERVLYVDRVQYGEMDFLSRAAALHSNSGPFALYTNLAG